MAIANDVLKVGELIETEEGNVNEDNETEAKQESLADKVKNGINKLKGAYDNLMNQLPRPPSKVNIDMSKVNLGIFKDFVCCTMPSRKTRMKNYKRNFDRNLFSINYIDICGKERVLNPFDVALKTAAYAKGISDAFNGNSATLLGLLQNDLKNRMKILNLSKDIYRCVAGKSLKSVYGKYGYSSIPLRSKNQLLNLLTKDPCVRTLMNFDTLSHWVYKANGSALINILIAGDPSKAMGMLILDMASPSTRAIALQALSGSMMVPGNTSKKMSLLKVMMDKGVLKPRDYIDININTTVVINNLSKETPESYKESSLKFSDVINIIKRLDPKVRLDIENGNYSAFKDCKHLIEKTEKSKPVNIEGKYKTELTPSQIVSITSAFNSVNSKNKKEDKKPDIVSILSKQSQAIPKKISCVC